jgi:hypothetical protein
VGEAFVPMLNLAALAHPAEHTVDIGEVAGSRPVDGSKLLPVILVLG